MNNDIKKYKKNKKSLKKLLTLLNNNDKIKLLNKNKKKRRTYNMLEFKKDQLKVLKGDIEEAISNNERLYEYAKEFIDTAQEIIKDSDTPCLASRNLFLYGQLNKMEDKIVSKLILESVKLAKEVSDLMVHIITKVHFIILLQEDCFILETM